MVVILNWDNTLKSKPIFQFSHYTLSARRIFVPTVIGRVITTDRAKTLYMSLSEAFASSKTINRRVASLFNTSNNHWHKLENSYFGRYVGWCANSS